MQFRAVFPLIAVISVFGFFTVVLSSPSPYFGYYYQVQHPDSGTGYDSSHPYQYQSSPSLTYPYGSFQPHARPLLQAYPQTPTYTYTNPYVIPLQPEVPALPAQSWPSFFPSPLISPSIPANLRFRIGVISDLDKDSSDGDGKLWHSYLKEGLLDLKRNVSSPASANVSVEWDDSRFHTIKSGLTYSGRGMELSTLNRFNGRLYACDDKTGVVYELPLPPNQGYDQGQDQSKTKSKINPIPWAILADGNFEGPAGFKCEWGTIKDGELWIGGHGKHIYNASGVLISSNDRFIKKIATSGEVTHLDWSENFDKMARALGVRMPGYVIHEAAGWSDTLQKWVFMPRKVSKEKFNPERDLEAGSSLMLIADEDFNYIEVVQIGTPEPSEGFSGFKFIPGTGDQCIVALKTTTKETKGDLKSFILAFDLNGKLLLNETEIAIQKYEAIEFL